MVAMLTAQVISLSIVSWGFVLGYLQLLLLLLLSAMNTFC
jgi:hypothetical protein